MRKFRALSKCGSDIYPQPDQGGKRGGIMWTHLKDTMPIAKKNYRCYLCGLVISTGDKHLHRHGVSDGEIFCFRMHCKCEAFVSANPDFDWETFDESELREEMTESEETNG
jgi:hypothetical protein